MKKFLAIFLICILSTVCFAHSPRFGTGDSYSVDEIDAFLAAINYAFVTSNDVLTDVTGTELETLSAGSDADLLHTHTAGSVTGFIAYDTFAGDVYTLDTASITLTAGTLQGGVLTDGIASLTNGNFTGLAVISGSDLNITAGTGDIVLGNIVADSGVFRMIQGAVASDPTFTIIQTGNNVAINQTVGDMLITAGGGEISFNDENLKTRGAVEVGGNVIIGGTLNVAGPSVIGGIDIGLASITLYGSSTTEFNIKQYYTSISQQAGGTKFALRLSGAFSGGTDTDYEIELTTGGAIGTAVFKWRKDTGAGFGGYTTDVTTITGFNVLDEAIKIAWYNSGNDEFVTGDAYSFTAEANPETILNVDTINSDVTVRELNITNPDGAVAQLATLNFKFASDATPGGRIEARITDVMTGGFTGDATMDFYTSQNEVDVLALVIDENQDFDFQSGDVVIGGDFTVDSPTFFVDSVQGFVGFGTIEPGEAVDVVGNINIDSSSAYLYDGVQALKLAVGTDAFYANTFVGFSAGNSAIARQTVLGYFAGNGNTGSFQTASGYQAGRNNTGANQTVSGYLAGWTNTGDHTTGMGFEALRENSGQSVVAFGYQAGKNNAVANQFIIKQANVNAIPLIQGDFSSGNVGLGVIDSDAGLEIFRTTTQLKLSYDATNYSQFTTDADGGLTIATVDSDGAAGDITLSPDGDVSINADVIMNGNNLTDVGGLHFNSTTELTISGGAVTVTQGHHRIDTEADAANDDLDTINGGNAGEILLLVPADDTRTVRIRHGIGNIFLKHQVESKSYSFSSPAGSSGTFYSGGYYNWSGTDANLTQASLSVTHSAANSPSACHIGIVAGGAGVVDTGVIKLTVTGTTIDDNGSRSASQTAILVADITTLSLNQYVETTEKWIGQVTITLAIASGSPVNFSLDINYGCSKYEDFGNQAFTINVLEVVGLAGASDSGFNLRLFHHSSANWTYAAAGFVPGGTVLANMNSDYSTEQDLANGESFAYKRVNLNTDISGDDSEGLILEITTGANKAVEIMDMHLTVHTAPNFSYMATTKQHLIFMKHGANWLEL